MVIKRPQTVQFRQQQSQQVIFSQQERMDPIKGMICKKYKCEADAKMSVSLAKFKESIQPQLASIRKNILKERERVKKLQDELLNGYIQVCIQLKRRALTH